MKFIFNRFSTIKNKLVSIVTNIATLLIFIVFASFVGTLLTKPYNLSRECKSKIVKSSLLTEQQVKRSNIKWAKVDSDGNYVSLIVNKRIREEFIAKSFICVFERPSGKFLGFRKFDQDIAKKFNDYTVGYFSLKNFFDKY